MADSTEIDMNVAALKRVDPYIKDILETATHVALYTFNSTINEWEKTDIEGALFVYSRSGEPYNSILIMNRLNTNNLVEPVIQGLDLQLQEPFLLYKNSKCNIQGIWFYDPDECIRISTMVKQLIKNSEDDHKINTNAKNKKQLFNKANTTNNVDIFSMLSNAQKNFNTTRAVVEEKVENKTKSPGNGGDCSGIFTGASATLGGLFDGSSQSVVDFFAKAKVNTGHFNASVDHQQSPGHVHVPNDSKPLTLARLMSHPAAHTVEHIEKQQRSITPQSSVIPSTLPPVNLPMAIGKKNGTPVNKIKRQNPKLTSNSEATVSNTEINRQPIKSNLISNTNTNENSSSFLRIQSPMTIPSSSSQQITSTIYQNSGQTVNYSAVEVALNRNNCSSTKSENTMQKNVIVDSAISGLPMAFSSMGIDGKNSVGTDEILKTPRNLVSSGQAPALIPPVMFSATSPSDNSRPLVEPLTKNQLLQALNYLIKNDPEFMIKLHEAYVKSFNEILS